MAQTYLLHEAASGYSLFEVVSFDEVASQIESTQESVTDLSKFSRSVKLKAFSPFEDAGQALMNMNAVSENRVEDALAVFLEKELPAFKKGKEASFRLGVVVSDLATAINDRLGASLCFVSDVVRELLRGIRAHAEKLVDGIGDDSGQGRSMLMQAQTSLGHSYSRARVKFNPARSDNMVIQSIALLDQLDKDLNVSKRRRRAGGAKGGERRAEAAGGSCWRASAERKGGMLPPPLPPPPPLPTPLNPPPTPHPNPQTFSMRIREWYSYSFPELKAIVKDNFMFARAAALIQNKESLFGEGCEDKVAKLLEIVGEKELVDAVVASAKTSMGMECSAIDMINVINFTQRIVKLGEYRKQLSM
jgi:RNA processing factor Prp31